jgi:cystathionine beta-lyase/cystathionine gamma-synthase
MAKHPATLCAHAGGVFDLPSSHVAPLVLASVFDFDSIEASIGPLEGSGYVYRRNGLPNGDQLAEAVAALEGAERAVATSSGMGAIAGALFGLLEAGDALVLQSDVYGGTRALAEGELARLGVEVRAVDPADPGALGAALSGARLALFETLSNPLLRELDLAAVLEACRSSGAISIVDNTFATPLRDRPIESGADLVVHSATKFLGGHHDLCAGVVAGRRELVLRASAAITRMGMQASPLDAWLAVRGLRTLELRMERAWSSAAAVAEALSAEPAVRAVHAADRCALVTFEVDGFDAADRLVERLELITLTPSLGGVTTTASHPATSSHKHLSPAARAAAGITDGMIRLSIGIESPADLINDLQRSLAAR